MGPSFWRAPWRGGWNCSAQVARLWCFLELLLWVCALSFQGREIATAYHSCQTTRIGVVRSEFPNAFCLHQTGCCSGSAFLDGLARLYAPRASAGYSATPRAT